MTIGIENEASQDEVWISSCAGNGKIKLYGNTEMTGVVSTINLKNVMRLGDCEVKTVSAEQNTFYLTFPLPEILLCDCGYHDIYLYLPNVNTISTSATCKLHIRRITTNPRVINIYSNSSSQNDICDYVNSSVNYITGIGNVNMLLILYNRKFYFSEYS